MLRGEAEDRIVEPVIEFDGFDLEVPSVPGSRRGVARRHGDGGHGARRVSCSRTMMVGEYKRGRDDDGRACEPLRVRAIRDAKIEDSYAAGEEVGGILVAEKSHVLNRRRWRAPQGVPLNGGSGRL